jgi:hypothetical protein
MSLTVVFVSQPIDNCQHRFVRNSGNRLGQRHKERSIIFMPIGPVAKAKRVVEIRRIERMARLQALSDYLAFSISKLVGAACTVAGAIDLLIPHAITFPFVQGHPAALAGAGLSLLAGPHTVKILAKIIG